VSENYDDDFDYERDHCQRCGGEGHIEYAEAGPDVWGEDSPSEVNHLVTCPDCRGTGVAR
jgi:hypothetical protein